MHHLENKDNDDNATQHFSYEVLLQLSDMASHQVQVKSL